MMSEKAGSENPALFGVCQHRERMLCSVGDTARDLAWGMDIDTGITIYQAVPARARGGVRQSGGIT